MLRNENFPRLKFVKLVRIRELEQIKSNTQILAVSVPIIDFKRCNDAYFFIKDGHICAGDIDHGGKLTEHFFLIHATSKT
jgi:hypothetical protein